MKIFVALSFALSLAPWAAGAAEHQIKESEVPRPVIASVAKKYPKARQVGFSKEVEHGKTSYEVGIADGARKIDIDLSADGKILSEEQVIALADVPEPVRKTVAASKKWGGWSIKRAERVITAEDESAPTFELALVQGSARAEIVLDQHGKLVHEESGGD